MGRYGLKDWDAAVTALAQASRVAIACHVNPDGDALGALFAASIGLRSLGIATFPSWGSAPASIPPSYAFLPGAAELVQPADMPETDVFLALDCGAGDRLGDLESVARAASVSINVDHHPGNDLFGTLNLVAPKASSTAELTAFLLRDLGVFFDRDIATCLYTGLVTDTGRFSYSNTSPETLRIAADLFEYDVPATLIAQEVFESAPFGYLKLVGRVLDRAVLAAEERFVYSWVTTADLIETGVAMDETEKLIDAVRATSAAEVAAVFKEQADGSFRVSLRSKGVSVGEIARERGGGGHDLAAGYTARDVDGAVGDIRAALRTARGDGAAVERKDAG